MVVEYEGYLIEQSEDVPEASVYRDNRKVMHLSLSRFLDSDELVASVAECMKISESLQKVRMHDHGNNVYDGEEPC